MDRVDEPSSIDDSTGQYRASLPQANWPTADSGISHSDRCISIHLSTEIPHGLNTLALFSETRPPFLSD